jgi:hypothetical protein
LNEGEKMFKKSNYDFEIYKELRKLNETINKRGNLDEDTNIKNKLELEYILDNARKYYSEEIVGEIRFSPEIITFSDESGCKYRFLVALDVKGLYSKSNLKIKGFNRFTKEWTVEFEGNEYSLDNSMRLLRHCYLIDLNEYPSAEEIVKKKSISLDCLSQSFPEIISADKFVNTMALSHGWRFGLQQQRYEGAEQNKELMDFVTKEISLRKCFITFSPTDEEFEELHFFIELQDCLMESRTPERLEQLGFYSIEPVTFMEEFPSIPRYLLFGRNVREIKVFGYPLIENELTNNYFSLINKVLSFCSDTIGSQSFTYQLNEVIIDG